MTKKGFTLIELLIVIAVLGVLSVGVLTAINVTENLNKANLAKAKTFSASVATKPSLPTKSTNSMLKVCQSTNWQDKIILFFRFDLQ